MLGRVAVVVVNYRTAELAVECLRSLAAEVVDLPESRVVVVDNASGDGSAERIAGAIVSERWGDWATLLPLGRNGGFSAGNNAALRSLLGQTTPPDWFLLLNPDTVVRAGAVRALLDRAVERPTIGIVGSRLEEPDGTLQRSAFPFLSVRTELDRALRLGVVSRLLSSWSAAPSGDAACRVDWVSGASMLIRREVIDSIGLLDDGYFLYFEEVDFCLRAARAGWECWYEPRSRVVHLVGQSTGVDPSDSVRRLPRYVFDSRRRYFVKNHGATYARLVDLAWIMGHVAWRVRMRIQRRNAPVAPRLLRDFARYGALLARGRL